MEQKNFTCRVDGNLKQDFIRAAKTNDRSASVLVRDFMRDYVTRMEINKKNETTNQEELKNSR